MTSILVWSWHTILVVHHVLESIIGGLGQEDVVVKKLWSDLSEKSYLQPNEMGLKLINILDTKKLADLFNGSLSNLID